MHRRKLLLRRDRRGEDRLARLSATKPEARSNRRILACRKNEAVRVSPAIIADVVLIFIHGVADVVVILIATIDISHDHRGIAEIVIAVLPFADLIRLEELIEAHGRVLTDAFELGTDDEVVVGGNALRIVANTTMPLCHLEFVCYCINNHDNSASMCN